MIYVPIIHTEADMGSMSDSLRDKYIQKYGEDKWLNHINEIDSMWNSIEKKLDELNFSYKNVKIYQDGLPNCGAGMSAPAWTADRCGNAQVEKKIVIDIAKKGSKNHQLLIKLLDKGAQLIGTENPKLLIEEYKTILGTLKQTKETNKDFIDNYKKKAEKQLFERDKYISRRIDETLKDNETGILFIGMMHKVNEFLPKDIKIDFLTHNMQYEKV